MGQQQLDSALSLAARGLRVFPLKAGTKVPAVKDWPDLATTDEEQIRKVWGNGRDWNIGVVMGGGFIGADIDVKSGKDGFATARALGVEPEGFVVRTPSGGKHVYLRGPDVRNAAGSLGDGFDVRGSRGYLVGPGSVVEGQAYVLEADAEFLDAPTVLLTRLASAPDQRIHGSQGPAIAQDRPDAVERGVGYLRSVAPLATEGHSGDHTTFKVAAFLKDIGVGQDMAVELMAEHWNDRCSPPWDYEDLKTKVHNAFAYGTLQPGSAHPAFEFAGVEIPPLPVREPSRWFRHGEGFALNTNWLFYETLPATGVAVLLAPTGAGKTFLAIHLANALATGGEFFTVEPDDRGGTLFVFAGTEGSGLARRLAALQSDAPLPISATRCGNLSERGALDALLTDLKAEAAEILRRHGVPVRLIVLETLAASGLIAEENDNGAASKAMTNLAQIGQALNALVVTSHHPAKSGNDPRGASAIGAAADYVLTIKRTGKELVREVELTKCRDAEERKLGSFTLLEVELGRDGRDRPVKSMSVSTGAVLTNALRAAPQADALKDAISWVCDENGGVQIDGYRAGNYNDIRVMFRDRIAGHAGESFQKTFNTTLAYLENLGIAEVVPYDGQKYIKLMEVKL